MGEAKRRQLARVAAWQSQALDDVDRKIIARLVEAVNTGEHCGTSISGPRRIAAISEAGFALLIRRKLLAVAMGTVGEIEDPHPRAQQRFLRAWSQSIGCLLRELTCNDEAFFSGLRVLLPPYTGPAVTLYRGQVGDHPPGVSWTDNYYVALRYCLYGAIEEVSAHDLWKSMNSMKPMKPIPGLTRRRGGIIMRATLRSSQIICAASGHGFESEFIVDPRGLLPRDVETDWGDGSAHGDQPDTAIRGVRSATRTLSPAAYKGRSKCLC